MKCCGQFQLTPLHLSVKHRGCVEFFLSKGGNHGAIGTNRKIPLHNFAFNCDLKMLKVLVGQLDALDNKNCIF